MSKITLRRYTQLAPLLHLLHRKALTLLTPRNWDDTNDAYYLEIYRRRKNVGSVLALCFAEAPETYHHWHVFAGKSSGVCLQFDKDVLVESLGETAGIKSGFVKYPQIRDLRGAHLTTEELPFVKRYPFQDEREFRIIYEDAEPMLEAKDIPFNPLALQKVTINPWMPRAVFDSVKAHLSIIVGWSHVSIARTTLVDNDEWKSFAESEKQASKQPQGATGDAKKKGNARNRTRASRG